MCTNISRHFYRLIIFFRMAKETHINSPGLVTAYIQKLEPNVATLVEAVRKIIISVDKQIGEHIKWNSPSFFFSGEMKPSDPKEYKRDIIVVNLFKKDFVMLVFPSGAKIDDSSKILEGDYADGRRLLKIHDLAELKKIEKSLKKAIKDWLDKVEK